MATCLNKTNELVINENCVESRMIVIPDDVKCSFCKKIFCCRDCRFIHEEKAHMEDILDKKYEEQIAHFCHLCNGEKFPFNDALPQYLLDHLANVHLPLKCSKCCKMLETCDDLKDVGKCCQKKDEPVEIPVVEENKENDTVVGGDEKKDEEDIVTTPPNTFNKPLTPSKTNTHWRRKSKEFIKIEGQIVVTEGKLSRQTSTPMNGNLLTTKAFSDSASYSASSIHISSINCTNNISSETDVSPVTVPKLPPPISPQRPKGLSQNRNRPKMVVQATPLRQVMSKSIQRAMQQHGHYRQSSFGLQQRKMSFNSTGSSSEASLLKFPSEEAPLDLRLSPAVRRSTVDSSGTLQQSTERDLIDLESHIEEHHHSEIEFEQIEVIIRRSEIKSESGMTSYKSSLSDSGQSGRSGSMPEIQFTPKIIGSNLMKKTIAFETPTTIERTPSFLMQAAKVQGSDDEDEADDVFYTPRATPVRASVFKRKEDIAIAMSDESQAGKEDESKSGNSIWNLMTSVMKIASKKGEDFTESFGNSDGLFNFTFRKPDFVQKAADYFTKRSEGAEEQPGKRRRTSSNTDRRKGSQSSPAMKRQKIQPRRPIERMRQPS